MPGQWGDDADFDPQDRAEAADETNFSDDGESFMTLEDLDDVLDVTRADGDQDEDEFDESAFDDRDLEDDDELRYRAGEDDGDGFVDLDAEAEDDALFSPDEIDGLDTVRDAAEASGGEDDFANFQARDVADEDLRRMGYLDGESPAPRR
ncbi:primosomal protein [Phenylobacterium sp.]|uniref:primosomal protein n=1 Tax=Phenylobacterium sp. TaxID=1871053 RepID=UPI0035AE7CC7